MSIRKAAFVPKGRSTSAALGRREPGKPSEGKVGGGDKVGRGPGQEGGRRVGHHEGVSRAHQAREVVSALVEGLKRDAVAKAGGSLPKLDGQELLRHHSQQVVRTFVEALGLHDERELLGRLNQLASLGGEAQKAPEKLSDAARADIVETFGATGDLFFLESAEDLAARRPAIKAQAEASAAFDKELGQAESPEALEALATRWADVPLPNVARNAILAKLMGLATRTDREPFRRAARAWEAMVMARPGYGSDEIGREAYIMCLRKAGQIESSLDAAQAYIGDIMNDFGFRPNLDNVHDAPINGEVLTAMGKAFRTAADQAEGGRPMSADMKRIILEELDFDPRQPPADLDFTAAARDLAARFCEAGFASDFEYYPGLVAIHANLDRGDEERACALAPLVWESCQAAGGARADDPWCLRTQVELALLLDKSEVLSDLLSSVLEQAQRPEELAPMVRKLSKLRDARAASGREVGDLDFVVGLLDERVAMLHSHDAARLEHAMSGSADDSVALETRVARENESWRAETMSAIAGRFHPEPTPLDPELAMRRKVTEALLAQTGDFSTLTTSHAVGGNVAYGGQITDMTVSRHSVRVVEKMLSETRLDQVDDPEVFDQRVNQLLNRLLHLQTDDGARPLEDLHSPEHKEILDPFDQKKIDVLECRTSGDSRTDILAILGFGIGDCRPTAFAKQLFFDVWKRRRHSSLMGQAFRAAVDGDQAGAKEALSDARRLDHYKLRTMTVRIDAQRAMHELYKADNDPETGLPQRSADGEFHPVENHTLNVSLKLDDDGLIDMDSLRTRDAFYQQEYELADTRLDPAQILSDEGLQGYFMGPSFADGGPIPTRMSLTPYSGALLKELDVGSTDFLVGGHAVAPATFSSLTTAHERLYEVGQFFAQVDDEGAA